MSQSNVIVGPDSTPVYPSVRKIRPADLKDALAKGIDDFLAMPSSHVFLGLIYPIAGLCLAGYALPMLFPLMAGFALVGPFAGIGLYEMSRVGSLASTPTGSTRLTWCARTRFSRSCRSACCCGDFCGLGILGPGSLRGRFLDCNQSLSHRLSRLSSTRRKAGTYRIRHRDRFIFAVVG